MLTAEQHIISEPDDGIVNQYITQGFEYQIFESLFDVLDAIKAGKSVTNMLSEKIDISQRITDPAFRFMADDMPVLSAKISEALAVAMKIGRSKGLSDGIERIHTKSIEVRKSKADVFALKIKEQIEQLKSEENVSTYRDIVDVLNARNIPTAQPGGKWHLKTVQNILKRAETLGH